MSASALRLRYFLPILFAFFFSTLGLEVRAQGGYPFHPRFKLVGQQVGLPERLIFCMAQDSLGYLWVGTSDGLFRHDGTSSARFFPPAAETSYLMGVAPALNPKRPSVMSLCVDTLHRLWLGTPEGLYFLDMATCQLQRFALRSTRGETVDSEVRSLLRDQKGRIWIATYRQGLFRLSARGDRLEQFTSRDPEIEEDEAQALIPSLPSNAVLSLLEDATGVIYVGTRQGLARWNEDTKVFTFIKGTHPSPPLGQEEVMSLAQTEDGRLWMATWSGGLKILDKDAQGLERILSVRQASSIHHTRVVHALPDGLLLVGTQNGLYRMDPTTYEIHRLGGPGNQHALEDQNIRCIFTDSAKGLWVGTYSGGLHYLISHIGVDFYTRDSQYNRMTGVIVRDLEAQGEDALWIATEDGGLNCFNPRAQHFQYAGPRLQLRHHNTQALFIDEDKAFVGYDGHGADIVDLNTGAITELPHVPLDRPGTRVNKFFKDKKGDLYAGTDKGLSRWDPQARSFVSVDSLQGAVNDICQDIEGNLWVVTQDRGAYCYPVGGTAPRVYQKANGGSPSDSLLTCFSDVAGHLWLGSQGTGLLRYDPLADAVLACKDQLAPMSTGTVYALMDDLQGRLWFSTDTGIRCLNPRLMSQVYHFTPERGLPIHRFTPRAVYRDTYGRIFFGGMNGFCVMNIPHLREERPALSVHIQDFKPMGADSLLRKRCREALRSPGGTIVLPPGVHDFEISYIAPEFDMPSNVVYMYKLSPLDTLWQRADNRTSLKFTHVPPGKYSFCVRAFLHSGSSVEAPPLHIEVRRSFFASRFMQLVYLLLGGLALAALWRYRALFIPKKSVLRKSPQAAAEAPDPLPHNASLYNPSQATEEAGSELQGELHPDNKLMLGVRSEKELFANKLERIVQEMLPNPDLSIGMLADALSMSQSKLQRKIKELYGTTPTDHIRSLRLEKAKELMDAGVKKVKDVCYPVGFSSSSYFAKCFVHKYGLTPGEYIHQVNGTDPTADPEPPIPEPSAPQE